MELTRLLVVAMAERCRSVIQSSDNLAVGLQDSLHPRHLLWMCDRIECHAEKWPETKLHRWIGFVQCGMMANRLFDLQGAKALFDDAKTAFGAAGEDRDLIDHLNPNSAFEMEVGGQG